jgi:hypothetical protein
VRAGWTTSPTGIVDLMMTSAVLLAFSTSPITASTELVSKALVSGS